MSTLHITRMTYEQIEAASLIADEVYPPQLYESLDSFYSKWYYYPQGALVLHDEVNDFVCGYCLFHPWYDGEIVPLNTIIDGFPNSRTAYLHDIAIIPELRGQHYGADLAINALERIRSQGFRRCILVAVMNSQEFWQRLGFVPIEEIDYGGMLGVKMAQGV